jgi:hypothetical protein
VAAALLIWAVFLGFDRNTMAVGTMGSAEPIDFSSLAGTVISLDEFRAGGNNSPVIARSALNGSATNGIKSDFGGEPAVLAASWRPATP